MIDPKNGKCYAKNGILTTRALIYVKPNSTPGLKFRGKSGTFSERKEIASKTICYIVINSLLYIYHTSDSDTEYASTTHTGMQKPAGQEFDVYAFHVSRILT